MKQQKSTKKQQWFNVGRIGAISDGVFAIAMTLLVLELKLPELEEPVSHEVFKVALLEQAPHMFSWLISFAMLCRLWIAQHRLLERSEQQSRGFTTMNFVFLGVISFIPFPASLVSEHADQPLSVIVFSATYVVAALALAGMWFRSEHTESESDRQQAENRSIKLILIGIPIIALISCLLAFVDPRFGIAVWIALPFIGILRKTQKTP